jgi:hypothetical protein
LPEKLAEKAALFNGPTRHIKLAREVWVALLHAP